jgi:hypothetical protein
MNVVEWPFSEVRFKGILGNLDPNFCIAPVQHLRAHRAQVGFLRVYYRDFPGFLIIPIARDLPQGAPGGIGPRLWATHRLLRMVNNT